MTGVSAISGTRIERGAAGSAHLFGQADVDLRFPAAGDAVQHGDTERLLFRHSRQLAEDPLLIGGQLERRCSINSVASFRDDAAAGKGVPFPFHALQARKPFAAARLTTSAEMPIRWSSASGIPSGLPRSASMALRAGRLAVQALPSVAVTSSACAVA